MIEHWSYNTLKANPWLLERGQKCLLSPDSDGFISGLLLTNLLGWEVVGFYDGKVMTIRNGENPSNCVFVDIEVNRDVKGSIGHHIVSYNNKLNTDNFRFTNCIQPNLIRGIDGREFHRKCPFGTAHLLISLFHHAGLLNRLSDRSVTPLLFTDGVLTNIYKHTENCLEWFPWFGVGNVGNPLNAVFQQSTSHYEAMKLRDEFIRTRDRFNSIGTFQNGKFNSGGRMKRTGDKLRISDTSGMPINFTFIDDRIDIAPMEQKRIEGFIRFLADQLEWNYYPELWTWTDLTVSSFDKSILRNVTNKSYQQLLAQNPLSLAMTSTAEIEYTLTCRNGEPVSFNNSSEHTVWTEPEYTEAQLQFFEF